MSWDVEMIAERIAELKRTNVPRASVARSGAVIDLRQAGGVVTLAEAATSLPAETLAALDAHLRHYAWLSRPADGRPLCPGCMTLGAFGWGLIHGAGTCGHCGWPGRAYHFIPEPETPASECDRCGRPRRDHVERVSFPVEGARRSTDLLCPPGGDWLDDFKPKTLLRLEFILWGHPYEVALTERAKKRLASR